MGGGWGTVDHPVIFALYSKNPQATHSRKFFIVDAPNKKKLQTFSFTPAQSTFGTPNTKIF